MGAGGGCFYAIRQVKDTAAKEIAAVRAELEQNLRYVYETSRAVKRGEVLNEENTRRVLVCASMAQENYLNESDLGARMLIDAQEGVQLLKSMTVMDCEEDGVREIECEAICLNDNRQEFDVVDVRLRYPNGEDYVVLAKKELYHVVDEIKDRCYLRCSEEEIARLSAAYVDTAFYEEACLYTAKYTNPELQEASVVTYLPTADAIEAMKENPNIVSEAVHELTIRNRIRLEERLNEAYGENSAWENLARQAGNYSWNSQEGVDEAELPEERQEGGTE